MEFGKKANGRADAGKFLGEAAGKTESEGVFDRWREFLMGGQGDKDAFDAAENIPAMDVKDSHAVQCFGLRKSRAMAV